jgi:hypothetical protein
VGWAFFGEAVVVEMMINWNGGDCWLIEASCGLGCAEDDDAGWWLLGMATW